MTTRALRRAATAVAITAFLAAAGATTAVAQNEVGSTVTVGGGASAVEVGDAVVLAPGVTITGGDVSNNTGIGVVIAGGTSAGSTTGGDTNGSIVE